MDAHGSIDILSETQWSNVLLRRNERVEIIGANLNSLLKAVFIVLATDEVVLSNGNREVVPGGKELWIDSLDFIFLCLIKLCRIEDIIIRVETLIGNSIVAISSSTSQYDDYDMFALSGGAITYLKCLMSNFSSYLPSADIVKLHFHASALAKRCMERSELRLLKPLADEYLEAASHSLMTVQMVGNRDKVCTRCFLSQHSCTCRTSDKPLSSSLNLLSPLLSLHADIPVSVGEWDPNAAASASEKLKAQLGGRDTKFKLEIFGGADFIDEVSDDEEEDDTADKEAAEAEKRKKLLPRVEVGKSLLQNPVLFAKELLEMDLLELARQWTLIDHALFQSLSLGQVLHATTSVANSIVQPMELIAGGTKRFIDRFNIGSAWLTGNILSKATPEERAKEICRVIDLAEHLLHLHNFHGLMSALSALQQGSIVRLQITFDHVPQDYIGRLNTIKAIMSGEKNQARYREELLKILQRCPIGPSDWKQHLGDGRARNTFTPSHNVSAGAEELPAVVPHLGAHVAALMAIAECHGDYLTDFAHLFNLTKWRLCYSVIEPIARLQRLNYPYTPIRMVIAAMHVAWKPYHVKGSQGSNAAAKNFYSLSESVEGTAQIKKYIDDKNKVAQTPPLTKKISFKVKDVNVEDDEEDEDEEEEDDGDDDEEDEEEEEEEEEEEPKRRKLINPFKLLRPFLGRSKQVSR